MRSGAPATTRRRRVVIGLAATATVTLLLALLAGLGSLYWVGAIAMVALASYAVAVLRCRRSLTWRPFGAEPPVAALYAIAIGLWAGTALRRLVQIAGARLGVQSARPAQLVGLRVWLATVRSQNSLSRISMRALAASAVATAGVTAAGSMAAGAGASTPVPITSALHALAQCESSGNYAADTGNGYYGAYQFSLPTWQGLGLGGLPSQASPATQDAAALHLWEQSGWAPWPACSAQLGLSSQDPAHQGGSLSTNDASSTAAPAPDDAAAPTAPAPDDAAAPTAPAPDDAAAPTAPAPDDAAAPTAESGARSGSGSGSAPSPSSATGPQVSSGGSYTVQPGDILSAIAARYGTSVAALAAANHLADPNLIMAGEVLAVPATTADPSGGAGAAASGGSYTVQPGDILSAIAARYGTSVAALAAANHLADPNLILAGEVLSV